MGNASKADVKAVIGILTVGTLGLALLLFNLKNCCNNVYLLKPEHLGQFGDFYGGILGTIVTFFGLYFIYHTYQLQNKQLDIAKKDADFEIINKLYSDLLQEINSIQFRRKDYVTLTRHEETLFTGLDALYNFDNNHWHSPNSLLNNLNSIIISFNQLILMANRVKYKYTDMKDIMLTKIFFLSYSKIVWPVYHEIYSKQREELLQRGHPDSPALFINYEHLTKQTYEYLLKGGHVGEPSDSDSLMISILKK